MMLDKRFNFFLCIVLVTCTSPFYKRSYELDAENFIESLSAYPQQTAFPHWSHVSKSSIQVFAASAVSWRVSSTSSRWASDQTHLTDHSDLTHSTCPPGKVDEDHLGPPGKADADHRGQSSESSTIDFLGAIDITQHSYQQWNRKRVESVHSFGERFRLHLKECAISQSIDKDDIQGINACICHEKSRLIVRLTYPNSVVVLDHNQLKSRARALIEAFYDAVPNYSSTGPQVPADYNLIELNAAINWLWNVLTKHRDHEDRSLPVIGFLDSATEKKDYQWGSAQCSLITYFTVWDAKPKEAAQSLAPVLAQRYRSLHGQP